MKLSDEEAAAIAIMAREWSLSLRTAFDKWPSLPEDHKTAFRDAAKRACPPHIGDDDDRCRTKSPRCRTRMA